MGFRPLIISLATFGIFTAALASAAGDPSRIAGHKPCGDAGCKRVVQLGFNDALGDTLIYEWYRLAGYQEHSPKLDLVVLTSHHRAIGPRQATATTGSLAAPKIDFETMLPKELAEEFVRGAAPGLTRHRFSEAIERWWNQEVLPVLDSRSATLLDLDQTGLTYRVLFRLLRAGEDMRRPNDDRDAFVAEAYTKLHQLATAWQERAPKERGLFTMTDEHVGTLISPDGFFRISVHVPGASNIYKLARRSYAEVFGAPDAQWRDNGLPLPSLANFLAPVASSTKIEAFLERSGLRRRSRALALVNLSAGPSKNESAAFGTRSRIEITKTLLSVNPPLDVALITMPNPGDTASAEAREAYQVEQKLLSESLAAWNRGESRVVLVPGEDHALVDGLASDSDVVVTRDTSLVHLAYARLNREVMGRFFVFPMNGDTATLADLRRWAPDGARVVLSPLVERDPLFSSEKLMELLKENVGKEVSRQGFKSSRTRLLKSGLESIMTRAWEWCRDVLLNI